ncbi:MAG: YigZ family protein [Aeromonas sp.]
MLLDYPIPAQAVELTDEIKKSRFITLLAHTPDVAAAKAWLQEVKRAHPSARHHCWAFVAGAPSDSQCYGFSDDGEPSGTAGKPMLAQLQGAGIGEISALVVRYYGGIQLGTGGLVKAYGGGVSAALKQLVTTVKQARRRGDLVCNYSDLPLVEGVIKLYAAEVLAVDYAAAIGFTLAWPVAHWASAAQRLSDGSQGRLQLFAPQV